MKKVFQEVALIASNFNPHSYNNDKTQGNKIRNMKSFSQRRICTTINHHIKEAGQDMEMFDS